MSITREQLKVGGIYLSPHNNEVTVVHISDFSVLYRWVNALGGKSENSNAIEHFLEIMWEVKAEPKKLGEVAWFVWKDGGVSAAKVGGRGFKLLCSNENAQRVTIKDNEIWEFYE